MTALWLVVVHRDTETSVYRFDAEQDARAFFAPASEQWSESYLARVLIGLGPALQWSGRRATAQHSRRAARRAGARDRARLRRAHVGGA